MNLSKKQIAAIKTSKDAAKMRDMLYDLSQLCDRKFIELLSKEHEDTIRAVPSGHPIMIKSSSRSNHIGREALVVKHCRKYCHIRIEDQTWCYPYKLLDLPTEENKKDAMLLADMGRKIGLAFNTSIAQTKKD